MTKLNILFTASEAEPLVKVGGLGDVAGSLPKALLELSQGLIDDNQLDVRLVLPLHPSIKHTIQELETVASFSLPSSRGPVNITVYQTHLDRVPTYLVDSRLIPVEAPVYSKDIEEDAIKYAFFSLSILELVKHINWKPDILHANDWHTATSVYALKLLKDAGDSFFCGTRSILTIHNLPFMGAGSEKALNMFGIPPSTNKRLPIWARLMPLPLGLSAADQIVAVSPTYAQEILTPEFGCDLQSFLKSRSDVLFGILNGIDQTELDPSTDKLIAYPFGMDTLWERRKNKQALVNELQLNPDPAVPLLTFIGRMDQQKGVDMIFRALNELKNHSWNAAILGSGNLALEEACLALQNALPDRVGAVIRYDARLARRFLAGGDMVLMPSRYEPCGLVQMNAMRYGSIPVARATGGLKDTISDFPGPESTGFLFEKADSTALSEAILRAISVFGDQKSWQAMQIRAMQQDFSWQKSALEYARLYFNLHKELQ